MVLVSTKLDIPLVERILSLGLRAKLKQIDFLGSLTLVPTVGCLLLGLSLKTMEDFPWSHPLIWGLISSSGVWGAAFVIVELRISAYPVVPIRLMRQRTPLAIALTSLFISMGTYSMIYNIPLVRSPDHPNCGI